RYYLFYTPDVWPLLPDQLKMKIIRSYTSSGNGRTGLSIDLTYTRDDDIGAIAQKYAGERDPRIIERYLRLKLSQSSTGTVTLPLEKLLHSFIRKNINTYNVCSGPNCLNSAISVNEGNDYEKKYINATDSLSTIF